MSQAARVERSEASRGEKSATLLPDTEGLHPIANTDKTDRQADVIFIHGLSGKSHSTWRYGRLGTLGHFFWPGELGRDRPNLGIWSLGYAADMFGWFGQPGMAIQDRARNLVLRLLNHDIGQRPIVFIAHSMGGLEVKEIVVRSQTAGLPDWERLVAHVRGIVFCGTPHRGAHLATVAKVLCNYLRTQQHLQQMGMGAPYLDTLHNEFVAWQHKTGIAVEAYTEQVGLFRNRWYWRPLALGQVVPVESGNPGLAGCACHPVGTDHIALVKPEGRQNDVYGGVLRFIDKVLVQRPSRQQLDAPGGPDLSCVPAREAPNDLTTAEVLFEVYDHAHERAYLERSIDRDIAALLNHQGIWVAGPTGCGKTSLLRRNLTVMRKRYEFFDLSASIGSGVADLFATLHLEIAARVGAAATVQTPGQNREAQSFHIDQIAKLLERNIREETYIHIDEIPLDQKDFPAFAQGVAAIGITLANRNFHKAPFVLSSIGDPAGAIGGFQGKLREHMRLLPLSRWTDAEICALLNLVLDLLPVKLAGTEREQIVIAAAGSPRRLKIILRQWCLLHNKPGWALKRVISELGGS